PPDANDASSTGGAVTAAARGADAVSASNMAGAIADATTRRRREGCIWLHRHAEARNGGIDEERAEGPDRCLGASMWGFGLVTTVTMAACAQPGEASPRRSPCCSRFRFRPLPSAGGIAWPRWASPPATLRVPAS